MSEIYQNVFALPNIPPHQTWRKLGNVYICDHNHQYTFPADVVEGSGFFVPAETPEFTASRMIAFAEFCIERRIGNVTAETLEMFVNN